MRSISTPGNHSRGFVSTLSPMNIKPLFHEEKEQTKHRILISQLHVCGNGRLERVFGGNFDACFSF